MSTMSRKSRITCAELPHYRMTPIINPIAAAMPAEPMLTADLDKALFAACPSPPTADALGLAEVPVPVGVPAVAFAVA